MRQIVYARMCSQVIASLIIFFFLVHREEAHDCHSICLLVSLFYIALASLTQNTRIKNYQIWSCTIFFSFYFCISQTYLIHIKTISNNPYGCEIRIKKSRKIWCMAPIHHAQIQTFDIVNVEHILFLFWLRNKERKRGEDIALIITLWTE